MVEAAAAAITGSQLDELIGGYRHGDDDRHALELVRTLDCDVYENALACATELLRLLTLFIEAHPFEDSAGRPFG